MMVRVLLSKDAISFLAKESAYLRQYSPAAAHRFIDSMKQAQRNLSKFPYLGSTQNAPSYPNLRRMVLGAYILDYIVADPIRILNIRHGRQEPPDWEGERSSYEDD